MQDVIPLRPAAPAGLGRVARRRYKQVCTALSRCEASFEEIERGLAALGLKAARLRAERESLREVLDREGGHR